MLLRLYKKLFNFRVKFEDLPESDEMQQAIFDEDNIEPIVIIDLQQHQRGISRQNTFDNLWKNLPEAIYKKDKKTAKRLLKIWETEYQDNTLISPKRDELMTIVRNIVCIIPDANLNWIDVSYVDNMSGLFENTQFNGDISKWDVSNVTSMEYMFANCQFNGDISGWDVSNVTDMSYMFYKNFDFNRDISKWDVSNVKDMRCMFAKTYSFDQDISKWKGLMSDVNTTNMFLEARKHKGL